MSQHTDTHSASVRTDLPVVSVGRVKRSYTATERAALASNDSSYLAGTTGDDLTAWARRASASSGFGDAATSPDTSMPKADGTHLAIAARAERYAGLAEIIAAMLTATSEAVRRVLERWRRMRDERATFRALHALDARTLHDLGLNASELRSVAVELSGATEPTRAHALMRLRLLAI